MFIFRIQLITTILLVFFFINTSAQSLTQTVRGSVFDADNKLPLVGAQIILNGVEPIHGAVTDINGDFRIEAVPVGRIELDIRYIGYLPVTLSDINVMTGRESVLTISLQESISQMNEIVVTPTNKMGEPLGEMAIVSTRSISSNETNRYAGGFDDPARILSNFAGVNNSQDGSADIIVRGNSPKYLHWRLEGVQITSPNHFAEPAGLGTGISVLNNNMLSTSDFYTGAFPAEFGNVLSGVYDLRLRNGNNEKIEGILGAGIVGTDFTLEGPFSKAYNGSFVANYRFTTVAILDRLNILPDFGGIPNFQDGAFKLHLPTKSMGVFSIFGLAASSNINLDDVSPDGWVTQGNDGLKDNISEDLEKSSFLINTGLSNIIHIGKNSYLQSNLMFSTDGLTDRVTENLLAEDEIFSQRENFKSKISNNTYRFNSTFNSKLSNRSVLQVGSKFIYKNQNYDISQLDSSGTTRVPLVEFDESIATIGNFISLKHRFNESLTVVAGLHNMNVLMNNKSTIEPRLSMNWQAAFNHSFSLGYGMHSTMESIHNYFAKVEDGNGNLEEPNRNLDLLKSHHFVLGYENRSVRNIRINVDAYYQNLYHLPVENSPLSSYSTINETLDIKFVDLVNKGSGYNYGMELTVERYFTDNYYYLFNSTVFQSKYKALDGVLRNTAFNNNYLVNFLWGKEFVNLGKQQNKSFGINTKVFVGGGKRIIPLLRDSNGDLNVNPDTNQFYDHKRSFENSLDHIYTINLTLSYKWSKAQRTNELFLNIDNITNNKPRLSEFYDTSETNNIGYVTPFGVFPNLMYRLYF